jgi:phospholipase C
LISEHESLSGWQQAGAYRYAKADEEARMAIPDLRAAIDHVVVVMFENRSFDNLLGRLYQPGEVSSFEGVIGKTLANPVPEWARGPADPVSVPYGVAAGMNTPSPDPGRDRPAAGL